MKQSGYGVVVLVLGLIVGLSPGAEGDDAPLKDFDEVMTTVDGCGIWALIRSWAPGYLPDDFSLDPEIADINGGFDISEEPIIIYGNGILDSDEFALLSAIIANEDWDCTATGGASHTMVHDAWNQNYWQSYYDLGGGQGGPEKLLPPNSMIPDVEYLFPAYMTLGDADSIAFPVLLMDLAVNDDMVSGLIGDPFLHVPDPDNYALMYQYLGWCGDADGDGCNNLHEHDYYRPAGRAAYLNAAMNPALAPPGCHDDLICDGTGGLFGEYFDEKHLSNLVLTRVDPTIKFNWGNGSPDPAIGPDQFSIRWTGWIEPEYSETYTFYTVSDDGIRLWVDGELVVDSWINQGPTEHSGEMPAPFVAHQKYPVKIEYYEDGGGAVAEFWWSSSSQSKRMIYDMYLTPGTGEGDRIEDWTYNPATGHYYRISASGLTWTEARTRAEGWGGYLSTINDADENEWVRMMYTIFGTVSIGLSDEAEEGTFTWANGEPVTYTNWNEGEPNDSGGDEDYTHMYSGGVWNDIGPAWTGRGVIERDTAPVNYSGPYPANQTVMVGQLASFYVEVRYTTGNVAYQWRHDGSDIPGAASSSYSFHPGQIEDGGAYSCYITDETPASIVTWPAYLTVIPEGSLPSAGVAGLVLLGVLCAGAGGVILRGKRPPGR